MTKIARYSDAEGRDSATRKGQPIATDTQAEITRECDAIREMLQAKNRAYGDSAMAPVRVFSRADAVEQLKVRIDDKLSRLMRGEAAGEDAELDLIGYLILLRIARRAAEGI